MKNRLFLTILAIFSVALMSVPTHASLISYYSFDTEVDGATPDNIGSAYATLGDKVAINTTAGEAKVGAGTFEMLGDGDTTGPANGAVTSNSFTWATDARTITFWWRAKTPAVKTSGGTYVSFGDLSANGARMDVKEDSDSTLRVEIQGTGQDSSPAIDDGQWHFIAVVVPNDATMADVVWYVDGDMTNLNTSTNTDVEIMTGNGPLAFGDSIITAGSDDRVPYGFMDEFQLYDEVLTTDDLLYLYNNPGAAIGFAGVTNPSPANGDSMVDSQVVSTLSWQLPLTQTDPDGDPNLVSVDSCDLYIYPVDTGSVDDDDPNFLHIQPIENVTSPRTLSLDYDTTYFWRVDAHVTWDSNEFTGTASTSGVIEGPAWQFATLPSYVAPELEGFENVITTTELGATLSATVNVYCDQPISDVAFTLLRDDFQFPAGADVTLTNTTDENDLLHPTATLVAGTAGLYKVKLVVTDGTTTLEDIVEVNVYADACEAKKNAPSAGDWAANYYDVDENCKVDIIDFAAFAGDWLDDTGLDVQADFDSEALFLEPGAIIVEAEDAYASDDPNYVTNAPLTDFVDTSDGSPHIGSHFAFSGGHQVGWTGANVFTTYLVDVPLSGTYTVYVRYSRPDDSARSIAFGTVSPDGDSSNDEIDAYGQIELPAGTGWAAPKVTSGSITFDDAGEHLVRVTWIGGSFNLDVLGFVKQ